MEIASARELLKINNTFTEQMIVDCYKKINLPTNLHTEARIFLLRTISEKRDVMMPNFQGRCKSCKGVGFHSDVIIIQKKIIIECAVCDGKGFAIGKCKRCNNGIINVPHPRTLEPVEEACPVCFGSGKYVYRKTFFHKGKECLQCLGKGKKEEITTERNLKKISICSQCNGVGEKITFNPVFSKKDGERLKLLIMQLA